jgi:lysosomal acid lipase/cholesteryl ester hydrolase
MLRLVLLSVLIGAVVCVPTKFNPRTQQAKADPEEFLDVMGIINHWGYVGEEHTVTTPDGYMLKMHRIPVGKGQTKSSVPRPVMFMQHGLECSSSNWVTNLPSQSAAYVFADNGYDVWMGNFRGNTYSRAHAWLPVDSTEFWQFSWDEMAKYDLPTMLQYVLDTSGATNLHYMGHSMGTMTAFALFSMNQTIADKVTNFFALGPVATVGDIKGVLKLLAPYTNDIAWLLDSVGLNEFLPSNAITKWMADYICGFFATNPLCDDILFLIAGADSHQLNETRVPVYVAHTPAGTSTQNIQHFGQQVNSKKYQMFDYGSQGLNAVHYHQVTPPLYNVSDCKVATYLFWGDQDILADPKDVTFLINNLPNMRGNFECNEFNHLDFIWGLRAEPEIYQKILAIIRSG